MQFKNRATHTTLENILKFQMNPTHFGKAEHHGKNRSPAAQHAAVKMLIVLVALIFQKHTRLEQCKCL